MILVNLRIIMILKLILLIQLIFISIFKNKFIFYFSYTYLIRKYILLIRTSLIYGVIIVVITIVWNKYIINIKILKLVKLLI